MNPSEIRDLHKKLDLIAEKLGAYEIATVATVMRRVHINADGSETPVVDLYPAWNATGTYGQYKIAHEYLNQDWQVERFEKFAGVKLEDLPLYNGQQALIRKSARRDPAEVDVQPFVVWTRPDPGATDEDKAKKQIIGYRRAANYQTANTAAVQSAPLPTNGAPPPPVEGDAPALVGLTPEQLPDPNYRDHWMREAGRATDPFFFDTALLKLAPEYDNIENIRKSREAWFGEWTMRRAPAYLDGMLAYAEARGEGKDGKQAKEAAIAAYNRVLNGQPEKA